MYLAISKCLLEVTSLSSERTPRQKKKKQEGYSFIQYTFEDSFYPRHSVRDTVDTKVNKTDTVCSLRANSIVGKEVIKQIITD